MALQARNRRKAPTPRAARSQRRAASAPRPRSIRTVALVSLGCPKNLVDSEKMLGLLAEDGLVPVAEHGAADAIVINTCGFLEASKAESLGEIAQAAQLKRQGSCQRLIVAGCLVQRHRAKLLEWCPDIDALIGVFDRDRIVEAVRGSRPEQRDLGTDLPVYSSIAANAALARRARGLRTGKAALGNSGGGAGYFESDAARLRLTPRHYAYLRISEGCNQNCAFCTIPSIRGKMRSKPPEALLAEARELLADGAFELNLIGQDTTSYGCDIGYAPGLAGVLRELDKLAAQVAPGGAWLRLMYAYPSCFTDKMIDAIADLRYVVKYIDMPLQHINDGVLQAMRRRTSRALIETLLDKLRRRTGNGAMAIRTTFISGFPGETEGQHRELVEFVREFGFDAMGVFPFSPEPNTPAGALHARGPGVPPEIVRERIEELMGAQQEVVFGRNAQLAARAAEFDVLIDAASGGRSGGVGHDGGNSEEPTVYASVATGMDEGGGGDEAKRCSPRAALTLPSPKGRGLGRIPIARAHRLYVGRTYQQAPQIDAVTYVVSRHKLSPGELVRCRITDHDGYDLVARPITDLEKRMSLPVVG